MDILSATRRAPGTIIVLLMCAWMAAVNAQSNGTGGFGSARIGATGGYTGGFGGQSRRSGTIPTRACNRRGQNEIGFFIGRLGTWNLNE